MSLTLSCQGRARHAGSDCPHLAAGKGERENKDPRTHDPLCRDPPCPSPSARTLPRSSSSSESVAFHPAMPTVLCHHMVASQRPHWGAWCPTPVFSAWQSGTAQTLPIVHPGAETLPSGSGSAHV